MIWSRRTLLYVALALCVPLPAFALGGDREGGDPPPQPFAVSVALDRCALLGTDILCKLDVSFDSVDGAVSYTAAVTRPNGSVLDLGEIGASPASVWVPYAGNGTYAIEVSAYGEPEEPEGEPKLLDRQRGEIEDTAAEEPAGGPQGDGDGPDVTTDAVENDPQSGADAAPPAPTCAADADQAVDEAADEGQDANEAADDGEEDVELEEGEADTISSCPR